MFELANIRIIVRAELCAGQLTVRKGMIHNWDSRTRAAHNFMIKLVNFGRINFKHYL